MTELNCCFLLCLFLGSVCADSLEAFVGQDVTIACNYDIKYYGKLAVCWGRGPIPNRGCANEVIRTDGAGVTSRASERYTMFGNLGEGDVSLTIRNLQETDSGTYGCRVDIPGWFNDHKHETLLNVVPARPNPPKLEPREVKEEAITVRWTPVFDGGRPVLFYRIDLKNKQAPWDTAIKTELDDHSLTQVTLVDLRPAKTYNLRMFAINSVGISESSNVLSVTTKEAAPQGSPLEVKLEALSSSSIKVTWKAPSPDVRNGIIRSYRISYREYDPVDRQYRQWQYASVIATGESQSYILTNLKSATRYGFLVQARTSAGIGPAYTTSLCATLEEVQTTTAPTVGTISPSMTKLTSDTSDKTTTITTTTTIKTTATTMEIPRTTSESATVWASVSTTFNLDSPEPPVIQLKSVKEGVISLLWRPGSQGSSPIIGFYLEYKTLNASWDYRKTVGFSPNQTEATIIEIKPSTYNIRMFARNIVGKSKASNVLTLTVEEKGRQKDLSASTLSPDTRAISAEDNRSGHLAAILIPLLMVLIIVAVLGTWQIRRIRQKKGTLSMWLDSGALRYRGAGSLQESL
ncbi:cell adhesion molecule DSCAML1-like isoform X2 [Boleophthalmus pectinirostris]|uniref:cell adhesion molecule DSCAML1-like isoform X2 n=1 Tax=Boleophthalmus pectinirostris TaxID=150288 RepID=UPI00242B1C01|nr:cell adhesion molecule DSCAML1-like isoform X2 [Boleophthalmus pectinirostris]